MAERIDHHGGVIAPQLLFADGRLQPNGRGMPLLAHKVLNRLSARSLRGLYLLFAAASEERYAFWLMGAAVAGKASLFRELGGWNDKFFIYYEDKDLSIRTWKSGHPVVLCGQFQWSHGWARETKKFNIGPWKHELASLITFYGMYPEFIFGGPCAARKNRIPAARSGNLVDAG